jgi:hypothetical protein
MPVLPILVINPSGERAIVPASCLICYGISSPRSLGHKQKVAVHSHSSVALCGHNYHLRLGPCSI